MKKRLLNTGFLFIAGFLCIFSLQAKDVVVNDGFETQGWHYWEPSGNVPTSYMSIQSFHILGEGQYTMCYGIRVWDGVSGGLTQNVYVEAGVTYDVHADFAYELC